MLSLTTRSILRSLFQDERNIREIHDQPQEQLLASSREIGITDANMQAMGANISKAVNSPK